jgi:hypothetical protein
LTWQPDPGANSIVVTAWHIARMFDILGVRLLEDRPAEEELWMARGWRDRTGYDTRGIAYGGFGALIGYTRAEVEEVPVLSADDLLSYFDQVREVLCITLNDLSADALNQVAPGWSQGPWTAYEWIRIVVFNSIEHLGEIKALAAMWERQAGGDLSGRD